MSLTLVLPPLEFSPLLPSELATTIHQPPVPTSTLPLLASLASQHHASTYHRLKYGSSGSPARYLPLSVHFPDHVRELQARQRIASASDAWWPCDAPKEPKPLLGPCGIPALDSHVLRDELEAAMQDQLPPAAPVPLKTSSTHPINISTMIPLELIPLISSHLMMLSNGPTLFDIPPSFALDRLTAAQYQDNSIPPLPPPPPPPIVSQVPTREAVTEALKAAIDTAVSTPTLSTHHPNSSSLSLSVTGSVTLEEKASVPPFAIGNLFLSSCPGKKVRLQGPVRGRSGVCRDLHADLRRMKDLGVGCVVCCLDDAELDFLGAPWSLYEPAAKAVGISVLRIPTPEGLAPLSPAALDAHLTRVIEMYTLHGVPVLVHCRGGVGRAGVVACCWMLKLGLCGRLCEEPGVNEALVDGVRVSVLAYVERIIAIARRRRSIKAIETYEQVQFLVDFVEYLRRKA